MSSNTVIKCLNEVFVMFGTPSYIHSDRGTSFMSQELTQYLVSLGIACSRTTPYNPQGNGQVERLNGTLWKTIQLSLKSKSLDITDWERVLPLALHSIRSLLCTATNMTPHERMFNHSRRTPNGVSLPAWLTTPGPILIKRNNRNSKFDPFVEEGELLQSNPNYSFVRYSDGREGAISNRHLAPLPSQSYIDNDEISESTVNDDASEHILEDQRDGCLRRSTRLKRLPGHFKDFVLEGENDV